MSVTEILPWAIPIGILIISFFLSGEKLALCLSILPFISLYPKGYQFYRHKHKKLVEHLSTVQGSNIPRSEFQLIDKIGSGASGEVFTAHYRGTYAMKIGLS